MNFIQAIEELKKGKIMKRENNYYLLTQPLHPTFKSILLRGTWDDLNKRKFPLSTHEEYFSWEDVVEMDWEIYEP